MTPPLSHADRVVDREADDANTAVVVALPDEPAYAVHIDALDASVADANPEYAASAPVATVAFAGDLDGALDVWRDADPDALAAICEDHEIQTYTYPVERLRPAATADGGQAVESHADAAPDRREADEPEAWTYDKPADVPDRAIDAIESDPATGHDTPLAASFHYVGFGDADAFAALVARHGLSYAGVTDHLPAGTPFVWGTNPGTDEQVLLATGCHPITGEHHSGDTRDEGYASYLYLAGPAYAVVSLYRDVHETATYMKGEFSPLSPAEDGDTAGEQGGAT